MEPNRRSNFFFSPPAHLHFVCAVTYMTEISLIVTLHNQFTSPHLHNLLRSAGRGLESRLRYFFFCSLAVQRSPCKKNQASAFTSSYCCFRPQRHVSYQTHAYILSHNNFKAGLKITILDETCILYLIRHASGILIVGLHLLRCIYANKQTLLEEKYRGLKKVNTRSSVQCSTK